MLEAMNITDIGLIRDVANPLAWQVRQATDLRAYMFQQSGQAGTAEVAEAGVQRETLLTNTVGTSGAPPLVQSVPPRPRDKSSRLMMILQELWTEVMTKLDTLDAKVDYMEEDVKPWLDTYFANQDTRIQGQLDTFESSITDS